MDRVMTTPQHVSGTTNHAFRYSPLAENEIRLLRVRRGSEYDEIRCDIYHFDLHSAPPYIAVSYRWGTTEDRMDLRLGQRSFQIMPNAWWALTYLRNHGTERYVWLDAVCVDQSEVKERNAQVQLMGEIYSRAAEVVVWLGLANEQIDAAFDVLQDSLRLSTFKADLETIERRARELLPLFQMDYWSRTWIIQEIVSARKLVLVCGDRRATWGFLESVLEYITPEQTQRRTASSIEAALESSFAAQTSTIRALIETRKGNGLQLDVLLHKFKTSRCLDPRDKIYGLIGLTSTTVTTAAFKIDYSRSIEDLLLYSLGYFANQPSPRPGVDVFELLQVVLGINARLDQFPRRLRPRLTFYEPSFGHGWFAGRLNTAEFVSVPTATISVASVTTVKSLGMLPMGDVTRAELEMWLSPADRQCRCCVEFADWLLESRELFASVVLDASEVSHHAIRTNMDYKGPWPDTTFMPPAVSRARQSYREAASSTEPTIPKFFKDKFGNFSIVCPSAQEGDVIMCILPSRYSAVRHYVLRPLESNTSETLYSLVGDALLVQTVQAPGTNHAVGMGYHLYLDPLNALALSAPLPEVLQRFQSKSTTARHWASQESLKQFALY